MSSIDFLPDNKKFDAHEGETILQTASRNGIPHVNACGGEGKCTTCRLLILDGIENCLTYIDNFNPEKSNNPFAYFTQITYYAFIRRIQKEKRQQETKMKYIKSLDLSEIMDQGADGSDHTNEYLDYMKGIIEQTEADKEKDAKENEGKKIPKRRPKYLDEKIKKEEEEAKRASKG